MKRKLDKNDIPTPVEEVESDKEEVNDEDDSDAQEESPDAKETTPTEPARPAITSFDGFGLDTRLLQAIAKEGFSKPTPVQAQAIPFALEGRDVLAHARTGSGKTAAYLLPVIEAVLRRKSNSSSKRTTSALILVPTNELADQVTKAVATFTSSCAKDVRVVNLTQKVADAVQRSFLAELPDIVVATPKRAQVHLGNSDLKLEQLQYVILDEADLLLEYGHKEDLETISKALPGAVQSIMASATLTTDVDTTKALFCKDPVVLELNDPQDDGKGVRQHVVKCAEDEKFVLIYVIFKLKLVKGKCIIFVADIDRSYRLKLYLEQFGIRSCVLNSELPVNSRIHIVEEFNKNVYEVIIASDEHEVIGSEELSKAVRKNAAQIDEAEQAPTKKRKTSRKAKRDNDYGISRGIDFKNVACVLNFDLPPSAKSYTHRIGRTGRAGRSGMALSFAVPTALQGKHKATSIPSTANDEQVLADIVKAQEKRKQKVEDYAFDDKAVDAFRYRLNDALRAVTGVAVREARTRELRQELINSEKLKRHFEENPDDLHHLRHDGELRAVRVQAHLKHVPDYLMPNASQQVGKEIGFVGFKKSGGGNRIREARARNKSKGRGKSAKKDPLKTFSAKPRK